MKQVIGTYFDNEKDARKSADEKRKRHRTNFIIIKHKKGFLVVGENQVK